MRKLLLLIFVFNICVLKAQHYVQGVPVDTVLYSGSYSSIGGVCGSNENPDITLATNLCNYVNGLKFMMIVDSVSFAGPPQFSPIHAGDTIILDATHAVYYTPAPLTFYFKLKLVGVPTTAGQNFSCNIEYTQCTCSCYHLVIMASTTNTSVCTVDMANSINMQNEELSLYLYPNPVIHKLNISGINSPTIIKLYTSCGALVLEQNIDKDTIIDTDILSEGIYTLCLSSNRSPETILKKIVIWK